ncbi:CASTOR/POLLUX-related putative ion channel [Euzebya rosea]|uniref:CASTOR/POLLUX-related putative ion channel n=1 Tax=Euzebya rosea TaxID=2052804 RepID=UPI001472C194|nr:NAD-binding protein [Euzebya rosea]
MSARVVRARRFPPSSPPVRTAPPARPHRSLRTRSAYAFDRSLSRGSVALIGWLGVLSVTVVVLGATILVLLGLHPEDAESIGAAEAVWQSLMRALDAGAVGADVGWAFRAVMLLVTIGGLFILSTLIGVLTTGIEGRLEQLRKGRSVVVEDGHSLILGWSPKVLVILSELAVANANVARPRVVVMAERDKVEMEDEIREQLGDLLGDTRVICRSGNPMSITDLAIVSPATARSVVLVAPEEDHRDRFVLRGLLALSDPSVRPPGSNHIVATIEDPANREVARIIGGDDVRLLGVGDLIARITAQTCRQSGLSVVIHELLDFDGDEIYFSAVPALAGRTWREVLLSFETCSPIGLRHVDGTIALNPPADLVLGADDVVIAIAADDDRVVLPDAPVASPIEVHIQSPTATSMPPERTLVLGWNDRGTVLLRNLDAYVPDNSTVEVVTSHPDVQPALEELGAELRTMTLTTRTADITRRTVLEEMALGAIDHVIILADAHAAGRDEADTDTMITLLHLRDLAARHDCHFAVVTEVLDSRNRELLRTTSADDFIVSERLISLLMSQVSETPALETVFTQLFDPEGSEIYLRPAHHYVQPDVATPFSTVVAAAAARGETAIGYRLVDLGDDPARAHGVVVNPGRSTEVRLGRGDRVIVLAEG